MTETAPDVGRLVAEGLRDGAPVRLDLPEGGRVFVDHAVPVLAVHRCAGTSTGDPALDARAACHEAHRLVTTQPAYVHTSGDDPEADARLVAAVADALTEAAPGLLVVEVWSPLDEDDDTDLDPFDRRPGFTIYTDEHGPTDATVEALCDALTGIEVAGQGADVAQVSTSTVAPPGLPPLRLGVPLVGLAVDAVFHNAREGEFYPRVLTRLRDAVGPALAEAVAESAHVAPAQVGRTTLEEAARVVDQGLSEVGDQFGFLLQVTPVNADAAWEEFRDGGCERPPEFLYRPLTFDADALRRDLFALPLDHIEDVIVADLLRDCRDEIEAKVRMILDIDTPQFLPGSLRVYGAPDPELVELARQVVRLLDARPGARTGQERVGATAFAAKARAEVAYYHALSEAVPTEVDIRDDIPGSLMVSSGRLLVGAHMQISAARVEALLAHEVGTHVLTYANGASQPLQQLRDGLAGYEDLQEGLAVLSEWLVGGLTAGRFRTLAGRVLGADALAEGASFVEAFRVLRTEAGLSDRGAYGVAVRLYRGGGLTKDMIYLRGLRDLLAHLGAGGPFWPLLTGKMALRHLDAIEALRARGVLVEPPLRPRYASDPAALRRLGLARKGLTVLDLLSDDGA